MEPFEEPVGDSGGDLQSLLSRGSDELAVARDRILGKFWEAPSSDDEDSSCPRPSPCAPRYVISSFSRSSEEGKSRSSKRLEKRLQQRHAAMAWAAVTTPSVSPCSDLNIAVRKGSINAVPRWHAPVLEPSTFVLDHFDAKEWITVQRRSRKKLALQRPEVHRHHRRHHATVISSNVNHARFKFPFPVLRTRHEAQGTQQGYRAGSLETAIVHGRSCRSRRRRDAGASGSGYANGHSSGQGYGHYGQQNANSGNFRGPQGSEGAAINNQTVQPQAIAATPVQQAVVTPVVDQVQQDGLVARVTAAVESVGQDLANMSKKKDKLEDTLCFRCDETGHLAIDCTAVLCLCCDSSKHATADCHLHVMEKPVAQMYGLCNAALLFFDVPKSVGVKSKRHSGKVGRIRVAGGSLSSHQVVKELSFLVPGKDQWDITMVEDNIFKVVYPTKADCARLRKINDIKVDDSGCKLYFEDWISQEVETWRFRKVWLRIYGCPQDLRDDYLGLFGVGSLFGKTEEVDMAFTREHDVVRLRILCINVDAIPDRTDHSFDGEDSGDDKGNERANPLNDDLPPSDAPCNDKSSSVSGLPSEQSQHGKQLVDAVQMCPIKFGSFDSRSSLSSIGCASAPGPVAKATLQASVWQKSAGHVYDLKQKKSWGAQAEEDVEESLPSPLAPCPKIASEREKNEELSAVSTSMLQCNEAETVVAVAADLLPLFSAAKDERAASAIESDQVPISRLPGLLSDAKPGVFLGTLEVLPGQEARAACSDPVEVDIPAVRASPVASLKKRPAQMIWGMFGTAPDKKRPKICTKKRPFPAASSNSVRMHGF
ncbi:hypothetical protein QYE76_030821 [Lolium multiflorum]|uniref:CCHC-type domain-containing protein n=1 Tax=Lolium multiflorum TaxID=4521 RepID=A0AAD8QQF5_LOLMU|nr:hypothetical protein QYE76_030821 [Lolium multiflorum]